MSFRRILQQRSHKALTPSVGNVFDIIKAPLSTEKAFKGSSEYNTYHFRVNSHANKVDIKNAVTYLFGVTPIKVSTMVVPYKGRANRKLVRGSYKKAIVTVPRGSSILFDS